MQIQNATGLTACPTLQEESQLRESLAGQTGLHSHCVQLDAQERQARARPFGLPRCYGHAELRAQPQGSIHVLLRLLAARDDEEEIVHGMNDELHADGCRKK